MPRPTPEFERIVSSISVRRDHWEALQVWADEEDRSRNSMVGRLIETALRDAGHLPQESKKKAPVKKRAAAKKRARG